MSMWHKCQIVYHHEFSSTITWKHRSWFTATAPDDLGFAGMCFSVVPATHTNKLTNTHIHTHINTNTQLDTSAVHTHTHVHTHSAAVWMLMLILTDWERKSVKVFSVTEEST